MSPCKRVIYYIAFTSSLKLFQASYKINQPFSFIGNKVVAIMQAKQTINEYHHIVISNPIELRFVLLLLLLLLRDKLLHHEQDQT